MFHPIGYSKQELKMRLERLSNQRIDFDANGKLIKEFAKKSKLTAEQAQLIIECCYSIAIVKPQILGNQRNPSEVYGEIRLDQLELILQSIGVTEKDTFVDIGSGVGQTTIYLALRKMFKKSYGIEISSLPIVLSSMLEDVLHRVLKTIEKPIGNYELIRGDCLDAKNVQIFKESTVFFMNDLTFTPDLRQQILELIISNAADGSIIINTSEALGLQMGRNVNERNVNTGKAYFRSKKYMGTPDGVSWTAKPVVFWINTLDKKTVDQFKRHNK